jgi:hypothetical protein
MKLSNIKLFAPRPQKNLIYCGSSKDKDFYFSFEDNRVCWTQFSDNNWYSISFDQATNHQQHFDEYIPEVLEKARKLSILL